MNAPGKEGEFFQEIIESLRACEEESPASYVSKEVLLEFYRPAPKQAAKAAQKAANVPAGRSVPLPSPAPAGTPAARTLSVRPEEMDFPELKSAVAICSRCPLCRTRTNTVFGDGNEKAELMFVGEGPGADEDAQGLPFVGKAGELLTKMILAMGFARKEVYIGNIVKCRPPNNRTPEEEEIASCLPYIKRQIALIRPKVIVLLGATPLRGLFDLTGITRLRGKFLDYGGIPAMPTFHPAYLLRNPSAKADVWKDLQQVMKILGKTPAPPRQKRS